MPEIQNPKEWMKVMHDQIILEYLLGLFWNLWEVILTIYFAESCKDKTFACKTFHGGSINVGAGCANNQIVTVT